MTVLSGRIAGITGTLADPELYKTVDGKRRAVNLGRDLEVMEKKLDDATKKAASRSRSIRANRSPVTPESAQRKR